MKGPTLAGLAITLLLVISQGLAANYEWTGAAGSDYSDPGNWIVGMTVPGSPPGASDNVDINGAHSVVKTASTNVAELRIRGGASFTYNNAGSFNVGTLKLEGPSALSLDGGIMKVDDFQRTGASATIDMDGGDLWIQVSVSDSGGGGIIVRSSSELRIEVAFTLKDTSVRSGGVVNVLADVLFDTGDIRDGAVISIVGAEATFDADTTTAGTWTVSGDGVLVIQNVSGGKGSTSGSVRIVIDDAGALDGARFDVNANGELFHAGGGTLTWGDTDTNSLVKSNSGEFGAETDGHLKFTDDLTVSRGTIVSEGSGELEFAKSLILSGGDVLSRGTTTVKDGLSITNSGSEFSVANGQFDGAGVTVTDGLFTVSGSGQADVKDVLVSTSSNAIVTAENGGVLKISGDVEQENFGSRSTPHFVANGGTIQYSKVPNFGSTKGTFHEAKSTFAGKEGVLEFKDGWGTDYFDDPGSKLKISANGRVIIGKDSAMQYSRSIISAGLTVSDGAKLEMISYGNTLYFESSGFNLQGEMWLYDWTTLSLGAGTTMTFKDEDSIMYFRGHSSFYYGTDVLGFQEIYDHIDWDSSGTLEFPPGGNLYIDERVVFSSGRFILRDNGTLEVDGGGELFGNGTFSLQLDGMPRSCLALIRDGGSATFAGGSNLTLFNSSFLLEAGGAFGIEDFGEVLLDLSSLVVGSQFTMSGNSSFTATKTNVNVSDSFLSGGDAAASLTDSEMLINSGGLTLQDRAVFSGSNLLIQILSFGSVNLEDDSQLRMTGGNVTVSGAVITTGSSLLLLEMNAVADVKFSVVMFADSVVSVDLASCLIIRNAAASLYLYGASELRLTGGSCLRVLDGSLNLQGTGGVLSDASFITLEDGSVVVGGSGFIEMSSAAELSVVGGSLSMSGYLNLTTGSLVVVDGGDAFFEAASLVESDNSEITVLSGTVQFSDALGRLRASVFNVNGDVEVLMGSDIEFSEASLLNITASLQLFATSAFTLLGSTEALVSGNFLISQSSSLNMDDSSVVVRGGLLSVTGTTTLDFGTSSTLDVESGNALITDSCSIFSKSVTLRVGGSLTFGGVVTHVFREPSVTVGGTVLLSSSANIGFETGDAVVSGNFNVTESSHLRTLSDMQMDVTGRMTVTDTGRVTSQYSTVTVSNSADFLEDGSLVMVGGTFVVNGHVDALMSDDPAAGLHVSGGGNFVVSGSVTFGEDPVSATSFTGNFNSAKISVNSGDFLIQDDVVIQSTDLRIQVTSGQLVFGDRSRLNLERDVGSAYLQVSSGTARFQDSAVATLLEADIRVTGTLEVADNAVLDMTLGKIDISGGGIDLLDDSTATFFDVDLSLIGGDLYINSSVPSFFANSRITIENGDLEVGVASNATITGTEMRFRGGQTLYTGNSNTYIYDTVMAMQLGTIRAQDTASVLANSSSIEVTQGLIDVTDSAFLRLSQTPLSVDGGTFQVRRTATFTVDDAASTISITSGLLEFKNHAITSFPSGMTIFTSGGGLSLRDTVSVVLLDAVITVTGSGATTGSILTRNTSSLSLTNTEVSIIMGSFELQDDTTTTLTGGSVHLTDGEFLASISLTGSLEFVSNPVVIDGGALLVEEHTLMNVLLSSFDINNGEWVIRNDVVALFDQSPVTVVNGGFSAFDFAVLNATDSPLSVESSISTGIIFNEDAVLNLLTASSSITVVSGVFRFQDRTVVNTAPHVSIDIHSGSFSLLDSARCYGDFIDIVVRTSSFPGLFELGGNARMELTNSTVDVSGIMQLEGDSTLDVADVQIDVAGAMRNGGNLLGKRIAIDVVGAFFLEETNSFVVSDSSILIRDGLTKWGGFVPSTCLITDTSVDITNGNMEMTDRSVPTLVRVPFNLAGGSVTCKSRAQVSFSDSSFDVDAFGGGFEAKERCIIDFDATPIRVNRGDFDFGGQSVLNVLDDVSPIIVDGGSVTVGDTAEWNIASNARITVLQGGMTFRDGTTTQFTDLALLVDGTARRRSVEAAAASFSLEDTARMEFFTSNVTLVAGDLVTRDSSYLCLHLSLLELRDASLSVRDSSEFCSYDSSVLVSGSFTASGEFTVTVVDSTVVIREGSIQLFGQGDSTFTTANSSFVLDAGTTPSELLFDDVTTVLVDTQLDLLGGSLRGSSNSDVQLIDTRVSLQGDGEIEFKDDAKLELGEGAILVMDTSSANMKFLDDSRLVLLPESQMNITGGSVLLDDTAALILSTDSVFHLTAGSFLAQGHSDILALPNSRGTIYGGALSVQESAKMTMIASLITIVGPINYNSTEDFTLIGQSSVVVNGDPVVIDGGVLAINDSSTLTVFNGSLILKDNAAVHVISGFVFISDGCIELFDYAAMVLFAQSNVLVAEGCIIVHDDASFVSGGQSNTTVSFSEGAMGEILIGLVHAEDRGTIRIMEQSRLVVAGGGVSADDSGLIEVSDDSYMSVTNGSVVTEGNSRLVVSQATVDILLQGLIQSRNRSSMHFTDAAVSIAGDLTVEEWSSLGATRLTVDITSGGVLSLSENAAGRLELSVATIDGGVLLANTATLLFADSTNVDVLSGTVALADSSAIAVEDHSLLNVNGGLFLDDAASASVTSRGSISIVGGQVLADGASTVHVSYSGLLSIASSGSTGRLHVVGAATLDLVGGGVVSVDGGELLVESVVHSTDSRIVVQSGTSEFTGADLYTERSLFRFLGGSSAYTSSQLAMVSSQIAAVGGASSMVDTAVTMELGSRIEASGGVLTFSGATSLHLVASEIVARDGHIELTDEVLVHLREGSLIHVVEGSAKRAISCSSPIVEANYNAVIDLADSSMLFELGTFRAAGSAQLLAVDSDFTFIGGCLLLEGSTAANISGTAITMNAGTFGGDDNAAISLQSVTFVANQGELSTSGHSTFFASDSSITVSGSGGVRTGGNSAVLSRSAVVVSGSGGITVSADTASWVDNTVRVTSGSIRASGSAEWDVLRNDIEIDGGHFVFASNSDSTVRGSTVTLYRGSVVTQNSARVLFADDTLFNVLDGSVTLGDNTVVDFRNQGNFRISGGDFTFSGSSRVHQDSSCITVTATDSTSGDLIFTDHTAVELRHGCFEVTGGDARFEEHSRVDFHDQSYLDVQLGSFIANGDTTVTAQSHSSLYVTGGNFEVLERASVSLSSALADVRLGNAIWAGHSHVLVDGSSEFRVSGGDALFRDNTTVRFEEGAELIITLGSLLGSGDADLNLRRAKVSMTGGLLAVRDRANLELILHSVVDVALGSVHVDDDGSWKMDHSALAVSGGNVLLGGHARGEFRKSAIDVSSGSIGFLGNSHSVMESCSVSVMGGVVRMQDDASLEVAKSDWAVAGDVHLTNAATLLVDRSDLAITGNLDVMDLSSLHVTSSNVMVVDGNVNVQNIVATYRQQVSFTDSVVRVEKSGVADSDTRGHFGVRGWVDVNFHNSLVTIDGDLSVYGQALVNLTASTMSIPTGTVRLDSFGRIELHGASQLINQGYVYPPGVIEYGVGETLENNGLFETNTDLAINCESAADSSDFVNGGTVSISGVDSRVSACIDRLSTSGVMELNGADVSFRRLTQAEGGVTRLTDTVIALGEDAFDNAGSISGRGIINGSVVNTGSILGEDLSGPTRLVIDRDFVSEAGSWIYFIINSFDAADPDAVTLVSAGSIKLTEAKACFCLHPDLDPTGDEHIVVAQARDLFEGTFIEEQFGCAACPVRRARSTARTSACGASTSYGSRNMAVVFSGCGGRDGNGGGGILSVEPPIYIVLPVGFGVMVLVVLVFGSMMYWTERKRKLSTIKKIDRRRHKAIREMTSDTTSGTYSEA